VRCRDATASSSVAKVWDKVFTHFHTVAIKHYSSMQIDSMACHNEFFVSNPHDVKENDEHALDFAITCLASFWSR
jgi:hypothetical protein